MPAPKQDLPLLLSIVTLGLLGVLYAIDPAYQREHYATAADERRTVELADGSRIALDPATQIDVGLHLRSRRVTLGGGRAVVAIAANGYATFDIGAGSTTIRADGAFVAVSMMRDRLDLALEPSPLEVKATPSGSDGKHGSTD